MADQATRTNILKAVQNKQGAMYGFIIFTLLVVLVLAVGAIRPTVLTIVRINSEIKEKTFLRDQLETKINTLNSLTQEYNTSKADFEDLQLIFPARGDFSLFMANMEQISSENGFKLDSINFSNESNGVPFSPVQLNSLKATQAGITVRGDRSDLIDLLADIEAMPMYPRINSVSFSDRPEDNGLTSISIQIEIYHVEEPDFYK